MHSELKAQPASMDGQRMPSNDYQLRGLSLMKSLRDPNCKPIHPGAVIREDVLAETGWIQRGFASRLMVSRQTFKDFMRKKKSCHCRNGYSHRKSGRWHA